MKSVPFWTDGLERPADLVSSPLPDRVDVAVVGGGYTGLNAARTLRHHGATVAVLEQNSIGWGASSRNGGMATPGIKAPAAEMIKRYGRELGHAFWRSSLEAIDLLEKIITEEQIECHFSRPGHVALAYKASHYEAMQRQAAWYQEELNYTLDLVSPTMLAAEIGSDAYYGGLVGSKAGALHPAKYVLGLGAAVARKGVCLCEHTEVTAIERQGSGFRLKTSGGALKAAEVLVATNGYTGRLVRSLKPRVFPVGSYIIVTEPLPADLQDKLSPKGRMFYDSKNFLNYFRLTPDGRMLFGGRNNLSTGLDLKDSADRLRRRMIEVFPELRDAPISHSWSGQLGLTFDLMPHIGRIDGVHYALGYCGHGVSIATYLGTEAGLLLAGAKEHSPFMTIRHPTKFFYRGRPWFLPFAALYYRFLDWLS